MGERCVRNAEVEGSTPFRSTSRQPLSVNDNGFFFGTGKRLKSPVAVHFVATASATIWTADDSFGPAGPQLVQRVVQRFDGVSRVQTTSHSFHLSPSPFRFDAVRSKRAFCKSTPVRGPSFRDRQRTLRTSGLGFGEHSRWTEKDTLIPGPSPLKGEGSKQL